MIDHITTTLPARHTMAVLVALTVVCLVLVTLLVRYARSRSRWTLAWCSLVVAIGAVIGGYGISNNTDIESREFPSLSAITWKLGLRSIGNGEYMDHGGIIYTGCQVTTNTLDERHVISHLTCLNPDDQRVAIKRKAMPYDAQH